MRIDSKPQGPFRYGDPSVGDQDEAEFGVTPSQTVGPYVHIGLVREGAELIVPADHPDAVEITVTTVDGDGTPIADAMIEFWQADAEGVFNSALDARHPAPTAEGFRGLGRSFADETGTARFTTVVPGAVDGQAPHISVGVFARGMLERLYTRLYFPEFEDANNTDPVLNQVDPARRALLVATRTETGYHLDIAVQHEDADKETPFFDIAGLDRTHLLDS